MDLEFLVTDAAYISDLSEPCTYVPVAGGSLEVSVVPDQVPDIYLDSAEYGVRGIQKALRVRRSEISQPVKGDELTYLGETHTIDDFDRLNIAEWVLYVI